jgi:beta-galactosidase
MGTPFLDPYAFVAGGLYNASNVELTNGNERGVATLRDGESHVGFRGLDFGPYGSDELILPLFPLDKEPFTFEIWEGLPLEGGERLCTVLYDKGSVWNTYQEIACRLPRRLRGVTTLCFLFRQKVHIKGFRFAWQERAFQRLAAGECDAVYGDSYTLCGTAVEGIGNNVTLVFAGMNFGEKGAASVRICWRSKHPRNSIQFLFESKDGIRRVMVEAPGAEAYADATFPLGERLTGPQKLSLVFLPGTELDLAWIQFQAE